MPPGRWEAVTDSVLLRTALPSASVAELPQGTYSFPLMAAEGASADYAGVDARGKAVVVLACQANEQQCLVVSTGYSASRMVQNSVGDFLYTLFASASEFVSQVDDGVADVDTWGFNKSVSVEGQDRAGTQGNLGGGVFSVWDDTEERARIYLQNCAFRTRMTNQGRGMARSGEVGALLGNIHVCIQAASEKPRVEVGKQSVRTGQDLSGSGTHGGVRMDGRSDLSHEGGGLHTVPLHITNHHVGTCN